MTILLEESTHFLREQISKNDKAIDSLLNQLSKHNDSASNNKTSNKISIQTELITDYKSTESSKKTKKSNTEREREGERERERVKNENKNITHINPKQSHHYTKMLTMHLLKKTLTIVKIIHRLTAVTSIQKARNR